MTKNTPGKTHQVEENTPGKTHAEHTQNVSTLHTAQSLGKYHVGDSIFPVINDTDLVCGEFEKVIEDE